MIDNMKTTWLIQRLEAPHRPSDTLLAKAGEVFAFGGGLHNGGLSNEAMRLTRELFSFDYMGSSEFEWGAVPKSLREFAADAKNLIAWSFTIPPDGVKDPYSYTPPVPKKRGKKAATIYALARSAHRDEVERRIRTIASDERSMSLKESTNLASTLKPVREWDGRTRGWLEIDNGFFFFADRAMWEGTARLFGVELEGT